ncbi:MAG: hypothetical protein KDB65_13155 [Calditrichaeota bacterium]|nr:hypothetical protein [Calditrichota bacterium]
MSTPVRILAMITLVAFLATATLPHYCSTGWCCTKHSNEQVSQKPSCCAMKAEQDVQTASNGGSCCGSSAANTCKDKPADQGCATGCCKIAAGHFVFSPALAIAFLSPIATLDFDNPLNTGIELTDYIPQPPRALSA